MILLVERNNQFIDTFWACVMGGIIVVPLAPGITDEHRSKLFRVARRLRQPYLCTDRRIFARLAAFAADHALSDELERLKRATVFLDDLDDISRPGNLHTPSGDDIAFVQFSSGSTSAPKGVALTHRNLLTNIAGIAHGADISEADLGLSWMPLTHDMGLIGFHLTLMLMNCSHHLMATSAFVRHPQLWLLEASKKRASLLCSPNFGYRHFLKTFNDSKAAALDLSSVRILFNGAEPISIEVCREFLTTLAPCGLKASAMFPVYGLAEASLAVTFPAPGAGCSTVTVNRGTLGVGKAVESVSAGDPRGVTFVLLGSPVRGCEMRIASDAHAGLPNNTVGHVQIRGENVTGGYYQDLPATQAVVGEDGWLDTGDLGFCSDGGLAITGRFKDIIFVSGQNYYPRDLEEVLEKQIGMDLGKIAVYGVRPHNATTDEVLAFILYRGELSDFIATVKNVKRHINERIGIVVNHVIPITHMPKTTSGKIQRYLLGAAYQNGQFADVLAKLHDLELDDNPTVFDARNEIEKNLKGICEVFIKSKPLGVTDNIFELGTSSLTLAQIYERIEAIYPGQLEITDFFDYPTISELARYLETRLKLSHA
uniref:Acyl-CoA synthetase n=1 Tax=uncultured bacterium CSL142 TaxID=1091569 RepID=G4WVL5_9BACT|nr:acyl-CoA synthetase [uncultured bacterium CSL142]